MCVMDGTESRPSTCNVDRVRMSTLPMCCVLTLTAPEVSDHSWMGAQPRSSP